MAMGRKRMPVREPSVARGPSGFTIFLVGVLLAALCLGAGFTIGSYILSTLSDTVSDNGGGDSQPGTGETGDTSGTSGAGGTSGGAVPAGGGAGTVVCDLASLVVYSIQVGAFNSRANADKVVADLASKGYPSFVVEPAGGSNLYKVRALALTRKDVAEAILGGIRTKGYPDSFVASETLDASSLSLSGSALDYLKKAQAGIEALSSCLRIEGDLWDKSHSGTLDRAAAAPTVDALFATVSGAKDGLASLSPPQDLAALGQAVGDLLTSAVSNLQNLKTYLAGAKEADRLAAETGYVTLVSAYARLGVSLRGSK